MSKGYPCHHSTCKSTSGTHIFCFLSSKMASVRSRGTSTYKEGDRRREKSLHIKKKKNPKPKQKQTYTDIITLQLIHLTSHSPSPHPQWSRKNFSVGLFYNSSYSLFLFSHPPPPKKRVGQKYQLFCGGSKKTTNPYPNYPSFLLCTKKKSYI